MGESALRLLSHGPLSYQRLPRNLICGYPQTRFYVAGRPSLEPGDELLRQQLGHFLVAGPHDLHAVLMRMFTRATAVPKMNISSVVVAERFVLTDSGPACEVRATRVLPSCTHFCSLETCGSTIQWPVRNQPKDACGMFLRISGNTVHLHHTLPNPNTGSAS
jgi:hypothetical protein